MRGMRRTTPLAVLILAAACGCAGSRRFTTADRTAVSAVLERQAAAWNRGDLVAYMDGYARTDALVFTSGATIRRGWQQAFDHYQARYGTDRASMGSLVFELESIDP